MGEVSVRGEREGDGETGVDMTSAGCRKRRLRAVRWGRWVAGGEAKDMEDKGHNRSRRDRSDINGRRNVG